MVDNGGDLVDVPTDLAQGRECAVRDRDGIPSDSADRSDQKGRPVEYPVFNGSTLPSGDASRLS